MPEVFTSLEARELSGEAAKTSREEARKKPTTTTRSDAPRLWRARRPLAPRVGRALHWYRRGSCPIPFRSEFFCDKSSLHILLRSSNLIWTFSIHLYSSQLFVSRSKYTSDYCRHQIRERFSQINLECCCNAIVVQLIVIIIILIKREMYLWESTLKNGNLLRFFNSGK